MKDIDIQEIYDLICEKHKKHLKSQNVKLPKLRTKDKYTKSGLVLVKLAEGYPNTKIVSKQELTQFLKDHNLSTNDMQQARHFGPQSGWYVTSGQRGDADLPSGSYQLVSLEKTHPDFTADRHKGIDIDFEAIKKHNGYRCATCGSKEGEKHLHKKGTTVKLQKGHMNPKHELKPGNIIPQCQVCNRPYKGKWIFDKNGRVSAVAETDDGVHVVKNFLQNASNKTKKQIRDFMETLQD